MDHKQAAARIQARYRGKLQRQASAKAAEMKLAEQAAPFGRTAIALPQHTDGVVMMQDVTPVIDIEEL